jgi:hypothetical protein
VADNLPFDILSAGVSFQPVSKVSVFKKVSGGRKRG